MTKLSKLLLAWYAVHGRTMPWRDHPDPYAVWVSEIMLQQTRVETVTPYFEKWMQQFPDVFSLANASEQDVLNAWEGLGYYTRVRNLHKAAQIVASEHNGKLPRDLAALRALPGIGRYTVGAIASIAFKMDEPTLDGNLRRVFARLHDVTEFADSPAGEELLWNYAAQDLPKGKAGDYNQALMDLGATICLPKKPRCLLCPLVLICKARLHGTQEQRPVLKPKKQVPHYLHAAAVILQRGRVLLQRRPSEGLLGGMWEFPHVRVEGDPATELEKSLRSNTHLVVKKEAQLTVVRHAYSHFRVTVSAFLCKAVSIPKREHLKWVALRDLGDYPMGKVDRQIAEQIKNDRR